MKSRTRVALAPGQVQECVREALGSDARVERAEELRGGTFNACWGVALADGRELVLKVAPPRELRLLTYEQELLRTEADFYPRAAAAGVPVPEVVHAGFDGRPLANDWLLVTRVPGRPLEAVRRKLPRAELASVRTELGRTVARLGELRGRFFGYAPEAVGARGASWRKAYGAMLGNLMDDAEHFGVRLPRPRAALEAAIAACASALDAVAEPRLVHFDLWNGNLFVDRVGGALRLTGVIDGERAFWGDPLAELPSLALFGEIERDAAFLRGYGEGLGRPLVFDDPTRARILLAALYLYLIMWIERAPRASRGVLAFVVARLTARMLRRTLARLDELSRRL
jgi:aminoglycoside phosphotransferase (APT) family kinase protein